MKTRPLAAALLAVAGFAVPARADLPVIDLTSLVQLENQAQTGLSQLKQLETSVSTLSDISRVSGQQLNELTEFYTSFAHFTSVNSFAPELSALNAASPLSGLAHIEQMLNGVGFSGNLAFTASRLLGQIQHYAPAGTDPVATAINARAQNTAASMATASTLYDGQTARIAGMQDLEGQIANSGDPKLTADLTARATMQNGIATAQQTQAVAALQMSQASRDALAEQQEQALRQSDDNLLAAAQASAAQAQTGVVTSSAGY